MKFTEHENAYLLGNYKTKTVDEIAIALNRDKTSVYNRLYSLGLKFKIKNVQFTLEDDRFILENLSLKRKEIAKILNRTKKSVQYRISVLSKKKWKIN